MARFIFDQAGSPYDLPPSLAENKSFSLANKLSEKREKLAPAPVPIGPTPEEAAAAELLLDEASGSSLAGDSLFRQAGSSIVRGAGNIADTYANIRQNAFGDEDYALSPSVDAMSEQEVADAASGFTGREAYGQDIEALTTAVGKEDKGFGDYLDIAGQGLALGPRALADSAASGLELATGAAATGIATAVGGPLLGAATGGLIFGKKVKQAVEAVDKVVSFGDRLEKGAKAVPKAIAKNIGRTSLLTADITEQMRQEYKATHEGAEPPAAWYGTNVPITMALNALEFGLISKALPKFDVPVKKLMKESVKVMSKSHSTEAAKRIFGGIKKIVTTAGAEAGQEYLQTWHEILAPKVDGDTLNSLITTAAKELGKDENQTQAIVGSILGFSAGGTAKVIPTAPGVAAGLTVDVAAGTLKTAGKGIKAVSRGVQSAKDKAGLKILSEKERESIREDYETEKVIVSEKSAEIDESIKTVEEAETFEDLIANEKLADVIKENLKDFGFTDDDLKDPTKLKSLKDKITSGQKAAKDILKVGLETSRAAAVVKASAKGIKDTAIETAKAAVEAVPEEVIVKTIEAAATTKAAAESAIKAVKGLKSSSARGIVEMGINGTVAQAKIAYTAAKDLEFSDLKRVASAISAANPEIGKSFNRLYEERKKELENFKLRSTDVVNKETLSPVITSVAEEGNIENQSAASVAKAIKDTMTGVIGDKETLATVKKAIAAYKASKAFTDKTTPGRISDNSMEVLEDRLSSATTRLSLEPTAENITAAAEKVKETVVETATTVKEAVVETASKVKDKVASVIEDKKVLPEGKLTAAFNAAVEAIEAGPDAVAQLIPKVDKMATQLKKAGYETVNDLKDLVKQFPGLDKNEELYTLLKSKFKSDVIMSEESDTVESSNVVENVFNVFEKLIPGCKK